MKMRLKLILSIVMLGFAWNIHAQQNSHEFSRFTFDAGSAKLTDQNKDQLDRIIKHIFKNSNTIVEIKAFQSKDVSDSLSDVRYQSIHRYMVNQGLEPVHFEFSYQDYQKHLQNFRKAKPDAELPFGQDDFQFVMKKVELSPCDSTSIQGIVHFRPNSMEIFETECHSIKRLYKMIKSSGHEWAIIGVSKSNSDEDRKFAMDRVNKVIDLLAKLGLQKYWCVPFSNYHKEPKDGQPRDWPYYPSWFEYEIGVYVQPYIE